jgi:hypothetical protein
LSSAFTLKIDGNEDYVYKIDFLGKNRVIENIDFDDDTERRIVTQEEMNAFDEKYESYCNDENRYSFIVMHKTSSTVQPHVHTSSLLRSNIGDRASTLIVFLCRLSSTYAKVILDLKMVGGPNGVALVNEEGLFPTKYDISKIEVCLDTFEGQDFEIVVRFLQHMSGLFYGYPANFVDLLISNGIPNDIRDGDINPSKGFPNSMESLGRTMYNAKYGLSFTRVIDQGWYNRNPNIFASNEHYMDGIFFQFSPSEYCAEFSKVRVASRLREYTLAMDGDEAVNIQRQQYFSDYAESNVNEEEKQFQDRIAIEGTLFLNPDGVFIQNGFLVTDESSRSFIVPGLMTGSLYPMGTSKRYAAETRLLSNWDSKFSKDELGAIVDRMMDLSVGQNSCIVTGHRIFSQCTRLITDKLKRVRRGLRNGLTRTDVYGQGPLGSIESIGPIRKHGRCFMFGKGPDADLSRSFKASGSGDAIRVYYSVNGLRACGNGSFVIQKESYFFKTILSMLSVSFVGVQIFLLKNDWVLINCLTRTLVPCPLPDFDVVCAKLNDTFNLIPWEKMTIIKSAAQHSITPVRKALEGPGNLTRLSDLANLMISDYLVSNFERIVRQEGRVPNLDYSSIQQFGLTAATFCEVGSGNRPIAEIVRAMGIRELSDVDVRPNPLIPHRTVVVDGDVPAAVRNSDLCVGRFVPSKYYVDSNETFGMIIVPRLVKGLITEVNNGVSYSWLDGVPTGGAFRDVEAIECSKNVHVDDFCLSLLSESSGLVHVCGNPDIP